MLVIICFLFLSIFNFTSVISFSREGRALHQFKVFPINLMSSSFIEFILFEVVLIMYMIGIVIVLITKDLTSMELKWVDIKDLLMGNFFRILIYSLISFRKISKNL